MTSMPLAFAAALTDPSITDLCLNGAESAFLDRGQGMEAFDAGIRHADELRDWVLEQLSRLGKSWDARHPFVDGVIEPGLRLHAVFPPLARQGVLVSLRRIRATDLGADPERGQAEAHGRWPGAAFLRLSEAVARGEAVLIAGATGSGKTTLASDLLSFVSRAERIIALEDVPELRPVHPHFLALLSRASNADGFGEVSLRTLLRQALRMRPDRIVLGECRGSEVIELLQALNTGHGGALATLHANSPRDALRRVELLALMGSGGALPMLAIRELLASGIRWLAQVERRPANQGGRQITELCRVEGREGDTILLRPVIQSASCRPLSAPPLDRSGS